MTRKPPAKRRSGSRRKLEAAIHQRAKAIAAYDQAAGFLLHIRTLAGWLEAAGTRKDAEPLDAALVSVTGSMILREIDQLQRVINRAP